MEGAAVVSKFSLRPIAATTAVVLALIAGGLGGYALKSQADSPSSELKPATLPVVSSARHAAIERAESESALESNFAASVAKHAQEERAEAGQ